MTKNKKGEEVSSNRHDAKIITDKMNVSIVGEDGFIITLNINFTQDTSSKGTAVINYQIYPGYNGKDLKGSNRVINETIKEIIRGEAITILSAKNAFENVFQRITSKLGMGSLNKHLMSPDNVWNIMSGFTRKFMGDFAQELNAIADKFGNNSGGKTQKSLLEYQKKEF